MKTPKVSVIIPIYNVERYLRQCLDSVVNQTLKDIEIICVNDGSTDASLTILEEYAKNDERVKIISKPNSGYGHTMNVGMESAIGEYIGIVESDDYIELDMYEILYNKAKENDVDFVKGDFYLWQSAKNEKTWLKSAYDKNYYKRLLTDEISEAMKPYKYMANWAGIYKREFINRNNIRHNETPGASYQDTGFYFQVLFNAKRAYFIHTPFYFYRCDNENSSAHDKTKVYTICDEMDFVEGFLNENPRLKKDFAKIVAYKRFTSYIWTYGRIDDKFKKDFLNRFRYDCRQALEDKKLDKGLFSPDEWAQLILILKNPDLFYRKSKDELNFLDEIELAFISLTIQESREKILAGIGKILRVLGFSLRVRNKNEAFLYELVRAQNKQQFDKHKRLMEEQKRYAFDIVKRTTPMPVLRYFEYHLVEHCNLNCQCCSHFSPIAQEGFACIENFTKDFERMSKLTNGDVDIIRLMGGEPLLHPDVTPFFKVARNFFPNTQIMLVTNGILLLKQSEEFWNTCRDYNIIIYCTKYPIRIDWQKIREVTSNYNVELLVRPNKVIKTSFYRPMDLEGKQDPTGNFINCMDANNCIFLRGGKLFTCCMLANIDHFNKHFDQNLPVTDRDYIDIYKAKNIDEILEFLAKPVPFCKYCNVDARMYDLKWKTSTKQITEWT